MKTGIKLLILTLAFLPGFCALGQASKLCDSFLSNFVTDYKQIALSETDQDYVQLSSLRQRAIWTESIQLKALKTHSDSNSFFKNRFQRLSFFAFEYAAKKDCKSSVDSLLDCFPHDCSHVKLGEPNGGEMTPSVYIINATTAYCVLTSCEDMKTNWNEIIKKAINLFAGDSSEIIVVSCGRLEWSSKQKILNGK